MGEEKENYKIDDNYIFYFNSGYVNANTENEVSMRDITGYENQDQLDKAPNVYIKDCLEQAYTDFMCNIDSGFIKWMNNR